MKRILNDRGLDEVQYYNWRLTRWNMSETRDRLDATGRGIYRELIDHCYGAGTFPDDAEWICRKCACTKSDYKKWWPIIEKHFPKARKEGSRHNIVADMWRKRYFGHLQTQRDNGNKGGRKSNSRSQLETDGLNLTEANGSEPEPVATHKERKKERKKITAAAADGATVETDGFRWPAAAAAVKENFPEATEQWVSELATACLQAIREEGGKPDLLTDPDLADIVRDQYQRHRRRQESAGLYMHTVVAACRTYAKPKGEIA